MGQIVLNQSDCRFFKSAISIDEIAPFPWMLIQIHKNSKLVKNDLVGHRQKWCYQYGSWTLKMTISQ